MRQLSTAAALAMLVVAVPAQSQTLKPDEVFSSIAVRPISGPNPAPGADGRVHLAYELLVENPSNLFVTLDKVEAVDGSGRSLSALNGERLAAMTTLYAGRARTLPPGGSGVVFMDVSFAREETPPPSVLARVTATRQAAGSDGKPAPLPPGHPFPASFSFTGAAAAVGKPAVVVEPPLKGRGWVAVNGCCDAITSHRGAVMAVNGQLKVPERFAIDFVKLDDAGRMFKGDGAKLASYPYYGTPVLAAADGVVVNLYNGTDEQTPGPEAKGINAENVGGNMVVVDIGGGAYAFYAHLQRDSLKVKLGDRVKTGQTIGLLGNTGNSTAPHLHFHVMDGPSPLNANGLPYAFTRFSSRGVLAPGSDDAIQKGEAAKIEPRLTGEHRNELPLNNEVVDFD
jgi:murein DD-endopeptidase MepM/ murein hydrolase activator NlpD